MNGLRTSILTPRKVDVPKATKVAPYATAFQKTNRQPAKMNQNFLCPITQAIMTDPVIGPDGVTYERSAIETWFAAGHSTSPMTRQPMTGRQLIPNLAVRAMIEDAIKAGLDSTAIVAAAVAAAAAATAAPPSPIEATISRIGDDKFHVRLTVPDVAEATMPTLFIDVLDVSGSMGNSSVDTTQATSEAAAFSRSDLVRHSVATQIELLRPQDELALVLFDNSVTIALDPTPMNTAGKAVAKACLPQITPRGGTNIWLGLQRALQIADRACGADPRRNVVIILQTDGESDPSYNPPRGIVDTFKSWRDAHPAARMTVHTVGYGFGAALDMPLLRSIAEVGNGTVNYIPDGSMVGTVFIHLMSNLMSAIYKDLRLIVPEFGVIEEIGFLQGGQPRDIVIRIPEPEPIFTIGIGALVKTVIVGDLPAAEFEAEAMCVYLETISRLRSALEAAEAEDVAGARELLTDFIAQIDAAEVRDHPLVHALRTDLDDPATHKGQICKAFNTTSAFQRWGRHYVPCVISQLERQWPTNFKDEVSKLLGGATTRSLVTVGDTLFNELPPPQPSAVYAYRGSAAGLAAASLSMAATNSADGPCFLGASRVKMADGMEKRCDEIQAGDVTSAGYRIRCVIKTIVPHADVVRLENRDSRPAGAMPIEESGGFTLWHPVFTNGEWHHPADVGSVERVITDAIYNFVLEWNTAYRGHKMDSGEEEYRATRPGVIIVNGIMTCTMGHDMTAPIVSHPYFGSEAVIEDLKAQPGWDTGRIVWRNVRIERDAVSGYINGMSGSPVSWN